MPTIGLAAPCSNVMLSLPDPWPTTRPPMQQGRLRSSNVKAAVSLCRLAPIRLVCASHLLHAVHSSMCTELGLCSLSALGLPTQRGPQPATVTNSCPTRMPRHHTLRTLQDRSSHPSRNSRTKTTPSTQSWPGCIPRLQTLAEGRIWVYQTHPALHHSPQNNPYLQSAF